MPHATLKLLPGVDQNRTLTLNEAAISESNLVRFVPDKQNLGLVQKLGGWVKFYSQNMGSTVRALWAWEDINGITHLGCGSQSRTVATTATSGDGTSATITHDGSYQFYVGERIVVSGVTPTAYNGVFSVTSSTSTTVTYSSSATGSQQIAGTIYAGDGLSVITGTTRTIITPQIATFNVTPNFSTTNGSNQILVTVANSYADNYDNLYIKTHVAVDGLVLFGVYPTAYVNGLDQFYIYSVDELGNAVNATSSASPGTVASYAFTVDEAYIDVTLNNHGYAVGDTYPILVTTHAGSVTLYGNYTVTKVISSNVFRIIASSSATRASVYSASWSSNIASVIYNGDYNFEVGNTVVVSSITPSGYNTSATVTSAGNQVIITGATWGGGSAVLNFTGNRSFVIGETIVVDGVTPSGYNGTFAVTSFTASTVSYALVSDPGTYSSGGYVKGRVSYSLTPNPTAYVSGGYVFDSVAKINSGNALLELYNNPGPLPEGTGYGISGYGAGGYGSGIAIPPTSEGSPIRAVDWTLDNWGSTLISCPVGGSIYAWSPLVSSGRAAVINNAPVINDGIFVAMPQRQIVAWGSTFTGIQDQLLIRWCDVDNYDVWTASLTNQAGSYRIPKGSKIVGCIQGPHQGLVWTDLGVWAMQYSGPPYVYQFNEIGNGCGLISRKAATSVNGVVYWMGQSQFFRMSANGVEPIRCPIWDVIFQDLDTSNLDKIRVAPNSRFGEVSWYYPTLSNGGEVSHYVKYNFLIDQWDFGTLGRTAWINESVLGPPIGAGVTNQNAYVYQHETSKNADGLAMNSSFQTGYFAMTEGEFKIFVDQIWPDMKWGYYGSSQNATVLLTFYVADYPGGPVSTFGPFTLQQSTQFVTPRFRGRLVSFKIESNDVNTFWRIGAMRYRLEQDGKF